MKCNQQGCDNEANFSYEWPGQGIHFSCSQCIVGILKLCIHMGWQIIPRPITEVEIELSKLKDNQNEN
jgi:hypothetical protein